MSRINCISDQDAFNPTKFQARIKDVLHVVWLWWDEAVGKENAETLRAVRESEKSGKSGNGTAI
jgi:hypothetical protein